MDEKRRGGPKPKYDWKRFQKKAQTVTRGVDFTCNVSSFVSLLHRRADADALDVQTKATGDQVWFKFSPKGAAK
jgi:hypothetical protein